MADNAEVLAAEWRDGADGLLKNRRAIIGLSLFSAGVLGGIALYQTGVIKTLPDPPLPHVDSDAIHGSAEGYAHFETPDALLGIASYAVTACLAGAGSSRRAEEAAWLPIALAGKTAVDAALSGTLAVKQWTKYRKLSFWSLLVTGATLAALPFALPEAQRALRAA